jgi:CheY-like chemotaxis protein
MALIMPELNGFETTKRIRSNSKTKTIPIVAISDSSTQKDKDKCILAGANYFLQKPLDINVFFNTISQSFISKQL